MKENLDVLLADKEAVTAEFDLVSKKNAAVTYNRLTVNLDGGYKFQFLLNNDQANIVRLLLSQNK